MVNFCKQELPFYWASSATLLPPAPSQPLSLSLPHFTATPNATIGIPNRFRDHSAPLFQRAGVVGAVNVESFHAPSPRPPPLFFPATLEKDNQRLLASIPPPFHLRPPLIYAVLQIFAFTFFPFLAPPPRFSFSSLPPFFLSRPPPFLLLVFKGWRDPLYGRWITGVVDDEFFDYDSTSTVAIVGIVVFWFFSKGRRRQVPFVNLSIGNVGKLKFCFIYIYIYKMFLFRPDFIFFTMHEFFFRIGKLHIAHER